MRRLLSHLLALLILWLFVGFALLQPISAQPSPVFDDLGARTIAGIRAPAGYEQLTLSNGNATALASVPAVETSVLRRAVQLAIICVESNAVRFRDDGVDPTAAIGMPIVVGGCYTYTGKPAALKFIRQSASNAVVNVLYYY